MAIEQKLLTELVKGKAGAQEIFYKQYFGYLMSICIRYLPREEALEACQDAFFKVFKNIKKYDVSRDIKKWLATITINECIDRIRKNKKRSNEVFLEDQTADNISYLNVNIKDNLDAEYILKLIDKINSDNKTVFLLHVVDGYSHKDISEMLNININTSRWRLAEARKELKPLIEKNYINDSGTGKYY